MAKKFKVPSKTYCPTPQDVTINWNLGSKSEYELWLTIPGNEGKTVSEYFESLRGPQGEQGIQGLRGLPGESIAGLPGIGIEERFQKNASWSTPPNPPQPNDNNPAGWSIIRPSAGPTEYVWKISAQRDAAGVLRSVWSAPVRETGIPGTGGGGTGRSVFKSLVFQRSATQPGTPTGGSYASPVPVGWSDGVPSGLLPLWGSTRVFTSDGQSPQTSIWTEPELMSDSVDIDYEWSSVEENPGNPTDNPANWSNNATTASIWMAIRKRSGGVWGAWDVVKVKGETGAPGGQGVPGQTLYTWLKYADTPASGMSDSPVGKQYMGLAYNKTTASESTDYEDYSWSLITGAGVPGPPGEDGEPRFTWIRYASSASGANISDDPVGKTHIGIAYNKLTDVESNDPSDYTWALIQGPQGDQGIPGPTLFTWIKYADSPTSGISDSPVGKMYMGIAYNKEEQTESNTYSDYSWSLITGEGVPGPPGEDGQSLYTWVRYASSATGEGISDSPVGKNYIGLAYNKTTPTESNDPADYQWALIKGEKGDVGPKGPMPIDMGVWDELTVYIGNDEIIQIVEYEGSSYYTRSDAEAGGGIPMGTLPTDGTKWDPFAFSVPSINTRVLNAMMANIANLVFQQMMSNDQLIQLNISNSKRFEIFYPDVPTQVAISIGLNEDNEPAIDVYNKSGVKTWSLLTTSTEIIKWITEIPESWTAGQYIKVGNGTEDINSSSFKDTVASHATYQSAYYGRIAETNSEVFYRYNAGDNANTATNKQYEGWHKTNTKSLSNWIDTGLYIAPGQLAPGDDAYKFRVNILEVVIPSGGQPDTRNFNPKGVTTIGPLNI